VRFARLLLTAGAVVAAALLGLAACGGSAHDGVIVRVGKSAITEGELSRWIATMAPEHVAPDPPRYAACIAHQESVSLQSVKAELKEECQRQYQTLRRQALNFLISSQWLIGEAASSGLKVSDSEVRTRLQEEGTRLPYHATGADAELEVEAELAAGKLRQALVRSEPKIPQAQIAQYYRQNIRRYEQPERRDIDIVERLHSEAAARGVMQKIVRGASLSKMAIYESIERPRNFAEIPPEKRVMRRAIFAAKPGVLIGPTPLNFLYAVFEVTRIQPRVVQPLAGVQGSIEVKLAEAQQRRTLAKFIDEWRARWRTRTDCHRGYVVQKCKQYGGPKAPENPSTFT
jgi:foldase protein PrsA